MARATIALGSNVGDRLFQLRDGVTGLARLGRVLAVSALYETDPVGGPEQGRYLNAVALMETDLAPAQLLAGLHHIEGDSARVREVRWGPRTLDLDLITFDDLHIELPDLRVPHPRAHERRFVLAPLREVAPEARLADGRTVDEALGSITAQGASRFEGDWVVEPPRLGREAKLWVGGQVAALTLWLIVTAATADPGSGAALLVGSVVAVAGVGLGAAAVRAFGRRISPFPNPQPHVGLVRHGVYRLVRHPMYGAIVLTTLGVAVAARSLWGGGAAVVIAALLGAKSRREERILGIVLPEYRQYTASVRRRLIPWVW
jgi:2-amino-4-hydroxy-6-hydroxymethyldihydropteridine diphosphokinase